MFSNCSCWLLGNHLCLNWQRLCSRGETRYLSNNTEIGNNCDNVYRNQLGDTKWLRSAYYYRPDSLSNTITGIEGKLVFEVFIRQAEEGIRKRELEGQAVYVLEAVKRALLYRYRSRVFRLNQNDQKAICHRAKKALSNAEYGISRKERLVFSAFLDCPFLYRWYMIYKDPTLLSWEKRADRARAHRE